MSQWHNFDADPEKPDTCLWCGRKLPAEPFGRGGRGGYGDGFFCGLRCAYQFGVRMAGLGHRLQSPHNTERKQRERR